MSAFSGSLDFGNDRQPADNSVYMSYLVSGASAESRLGAQRLTSALGQILVWNGALHNRDELLEQVHSLDGNGSGLADSTIVISAFVKWGPACFRKLVGDFSLALWDGRSKSLYLARDTAGVRPLFYNIDKNRIAFSTEIGALLDRADIEIEIDDRYVGGYLSNTADPEVTPYKRINAVKPAHLVSVRQDGQLREERYWGLDPCREIRYRNNRQYEEHFLSVFGDAVRQRLRSSCPAVAELSGGLDSSSIVCMADRLVADASVNSPRIETVSYVYDEALTSDERHFIRVVEEHRGVPGHHINERDYSTLAFPDDDSAAIVYPEDCFQGYRHGLRKILEKLGARSVLSGQGGDEIMGGAVNHLATLADRIVRWEPVRFHRELQRWSRSLREPYLKLLLQSAAATIMPRALTPLFSTRRALTLPSWYSREFAKSVDLSQRMLGPRDIFGFRLPSDQDHSIGFTSAATLVSLESQNRVPGIEFSYPYLHRPLVEFMQAIPSEQRALPGKYRSLMRRALQGILPDRIASRRTKGIGTEAICRGLRRHWPQIQLLFHTSDVRAHKYINPSEFLRTLERARNGIEPRVSEIIRIISLECWLRAVERRRTLRSIDQTN